MVFVFVGVPALAIALCLIFGLGLAGKAVQMSQGPKLSFAERTALMCKLNSGVEGDVALFRGFSYEIKKCVVEDSQICVYIECCNRKEKEATPVHIRVWIADKKNLVYLDNSLLNKEMQPLPPKGSFVYKETFPAEGFGKKVGVHLQAYGDGVKSSVSCDTLTLIDKTFKI